MATNLIHKTAFGVYDLGWRIALPWLRFHHRLADGYQQRLFHSRPPQTADLWIQSASVGESYLTLEVLKSLAVKNPLRVLLTANTRQGIEILQEGCLKDLRDKALIQADVRYFPFDQPSIMAVAAAGIRPRLMVLMETEIWPGLLRALKAQGCRTVIINGRITAQSLQRYLLWPSIWQALRPDKILAISAADAERFGRLFGPNGIEVMGNIKFDRISPPGSSETSNRELKALLPPGISFVILASVRREEESQVKNIIQEVLVHRPNIIVGLFPRHRHRVEFWRDTLSRMQIQWSLRSSLSQPVPAGHVIIWDTFGELTSAYHLAQSAFVGGSLAPLGGQNFLEALVSGIIPVIGPSWENFVWIGQEIIEAGLLRIAGDWREVAALIIKELNEAPPPRDKVIGDALRFITARQGGTAQACRQIEALLFEN